MTVIERSPYTCLWELIGSEYGFCILRSYLIKNVSFAPADLKSMGNLALVEQLKSLYTEVATSLWGLSPVKGVLSIVETNHVVYLGFDSVSRNLLALWSDKSYCFLVLVPLLCRFKCLCW